MITPVGTGRAVSECPACPAVQDSANTAKETHDIGLGNNFLDRTPKSPSEKGKIIFLELYFLVLLGVI